MKRWKKWAALLVMCLAASAIVYAASWEPVMWDSGKYTEATVGVDSCAAAVRGLPNLLPGQADTSGVLDLRNAEWARVFITATADSMRGFVQKSYDAITWVHQDSFSRLNSANAYTVLYDSLYTRSVGGGKRVPSIPAPFLRFIIAQAEMGQESLYAGTDSASMVPKDKVTGIKIGAILGN